VKKSAPTCLHCSCRRVLAPLPPPICPTLLHRRPAPRHDALPLRIRRRGRLGCRAGAARSPATGYTALLRQGHAKTKDGAPGVGPHTPPPSSPRWTTTRRSLSPPLQ
jgi:hypothetical protein